MKRYSKIFRSCIATAGLSSSAKAGPGQELERARCQQSCSATLSELHFLCSQQLKAEPKLAKSKCNPTSSSALQPLQAGTNWFSFGDPDKECGAEMKLFQVLFSL